MASFNLFLLLLALVSLFVHCSTSPINEAAIDKDTHAYYNCTRNGTSANHRIYSSNIKTLLDWLSSNGTNNAGYYNTTVASKNTTDNVYGLFWCTKGTYPKTCQICVIEAAKIISSLCRIAREATIWYQRCVVRYSDRCFFSTVEESPQLSFMNDKDYVGQIGLFNKIRSDLFNDLRTEAENASTRYFYKSANITENQKLYGSAWCIPYLSMYNCSWCIGDAIAEVQTSCCKGKAGGTIIYPSCGVKFELYPFHMEQDTIASVPPLPSAHPGFS